MYNYLYNKSMELKTSLILKWTWIPNHISWHYIIHTFIKWLWLTKIGNKNCIHACNEEPIIKQVTNKPLKVRTTVYYSSTCTYLKKCTIKICLRFFLFYVDDISRSFSEDLILALFARVFSLSLTIHPSNIWI